MWATYNEWKANNRIVDKGQVCQLRDPEHRALFHHSQTVEPKQEHWFDNYEMKDYPFPD